MPPIDHGRINSGVRKRRPMCGSENNFAVGIRVPDSHRAALERAAGLRGLSVAGFVEWLVDRALAEAGDPSRSSAPACAAAGTRSAW
jgi:hypothetical protein